MFKRFPESKRSPTVPVLCCCGALSQPIQTPVQSMLDPVLCAWGVLHLHHSGSVEGWRRQTILSMSVQYYRIIFKFICLHAQCAHTYSLFMDSIYYHIMFCMTADPAVSMKITLRRYTNHEGIFLRKSRHTVVCAVLLTWFLKYHMQCNSHCAFEKPPAAL